MTYVYTDVDTAIINRGLQPLGTRTTVTTAEMNALSSNEAIQMNLIYTAYRDQLLRMAQWDCALKFDNLIWLTSSPGTPENTSPFTNNWVRGQPAPPWAYEYLYPDDCLRACWIIPNSQTGFVGTTPITNAVTGGYSTTVFGAPVVFKVTTDQFRAGFGLSIVFGGINYQVNDTVILGTDTLGFNFNPGLVPAGIIKIKVLSVDGSGAILTASLQAFDGAQVSQNALLFGVPTYNLVQVQTSGLGSGAIATVSGVSQANFSARVILTQQEFAMMAYIRQITDPNVFDPLFIEAFAYVLGGGVVWALTGDKTLANGLVGLANGKIMEARKVDGNEGLTINNVTPDWVRVRGYNQGSGTWDAGWSPSDGFDWGGVWSTW